MTLDTLRIGSQVEAMAHSLAQRQREAGERIRRALTTLSATHWQVLLSKETRSKFTGLAAAPLEALDVRRPAPSLGEEYTVVAVDGSHIEIDRHRPVACYLMNMGGARLRYGPKAEASLTSEPRLYFESEDLFISPASGDPVRGGEPLEGLVFHARRSQKEIEHLARGLSEAEPSSFTLGLVDGSLILWGLSGRGVEDYVREALLGKGYLQALRAVERLGEERPLAVAGYTSFPRSTEVVSALRLALCPWEATNCDRCAHHPPTEGRRCMDAAGVLDRELFQSFLAPGQRSALFANRSRVVTECYGDQEVYFFYLRGEAEVARVEVPRWVAEGGWLDMVQGVLLEQCRLGQGYPVALSEAHEQAVVTGADRELFWRIVDQALTARDIWGDGSQKSRSKRTRWV
ncbi:MAG: DNA double-strand break repair nuclease NurA [Chloroflexi bacterium]|nr:DNA double-strand break repair nuclease NurA [Chloroflexota bacterium]